jgi:hypothetical protein
MVQSNTAVCPCPDPNHCQKRDIRKCANNEEVNPTCIRWPFVDVDSDGCFAADSEAADLPLPFPFIRDICLAAFNASAAGSPGCSQAACNPAVPGCTCTGTLPNCSCSAYIFNASATWAQIGCQYNRNSDTPRSHVSISTPYGITTPAEMKCYDGTAMLKNGAGMKRDNCYVDVYAGGDFRNYAWGAWKNHLKGTRLQVVAANIILGGAAIAGLPDPTVPPNATPWLPYEVNMNWDEDTVLQATAPDGCIIAGSYLGPVGNDHEIRINNGTLLIQALGPVQIPAPWSLSGDPPPVPAVDIHGCPCDVTASYPPFPTGSCVCP